jgi:hypothetical protein
MRGIGVPVLTVRRYAGENTNIVTLLRCKKQVSIANSGGALGPVSLAVDIGGTFTDVVPPRRHLFIDKTLTTPDDY